MDDTQGTYLPMISLLCLYACYVYSIDCYDDTQGIYLSCVLRNLYVQLIKQ
jgi:hypothetical protein